MVNVLIVGAGLMARAIQYEIPEAPIVGHDRIDLTSYDSIVRVLREYKPDVAINTVAYHRLAECERNASLAFDVNAHGAGRLAALVPTIYLSTDYVFQDGGPHDEVMPGRQPRSVYGRSKLAGELETLERDGIVVRISAVFDERFQSHKGPCFPEVVATKYDNFRFPNDQIFSPTYAKDAARQVGWLTQNFETKPLGIYHAANSGSTTWVNLASTTLAILRRNYKVTGFEAKDPLRPTNSALRSTRLPPLRHWMNALDEWAHLRQGRLIEEREVAPVRA